MWNDPSTEKGIKIENGQEKNFAYEKKRYEMDSRIFGTELGQNALDQMQQKEEDSQPKEIKDTDELRKKDRNYSDLFGTGYEKDSKQNMFFLHINQSLNYFLF